jgi:hypothetical protein
MSFPILNSRIHQLCILCFLRCGEDEGRVGGSILRLVFGDCYDTDQQLLTDEQ